MTDGPELFPKRLVSPTRRTRVVNVYDQVIGRGYTYLGAYIRRRRAIEDVS